MIKIIQIVDGETKPIEHLTPQSWIHAANPTGPELATLQTIVQPKELLGQVLDFDERPRVLRRGEVITTVVHFPLRQPQGTKIPYLTAPVSILLLPEYIITIELEDMGVFEILNQSPPSGMGADEKTCFIIDVLSHAAAEYLTCLDAINDDIEEIEERLQRSLHNREVLQLLNYQKSLVYFTTALNSIEVLLEKLHKGEMIAWSSENQERFEDVLIEIRQAVYQVDIAQNILTQMMDAFASIVSNNLNTVMKFLAAITIVISIPMLIASLYGMNVPLPGGANPSTLGILIFLSLILSILVIVVFRKMDWL
jgi:magnesium transporter